MVAVRCAKAVACASTARWAEAARRLRESTRGRGQAGFGAGGVLSLVEGMSGVW